MIRPSNTQEYHNAQESIFYGTFYQYFFRVSFCNTGSIVFLPEKMIVYGDMVTMLFLPFIHFSGAIFFLIISTWLFSDLGLFIGIFLTLLFGIISAYYVNKHWKGVTQQISYLDISDVTLQRCRLTFRQRNQRPEIISFTVPPQLGAAFQQEVRRRFPSAYMHEVHKRHR